MFVVGKMPSICQVTFRLYENKDILAEKWCVGCSSVVHCMKTVLKHNNQSRSVCLPYSCVCGEESFRKNKTYSV